MFHLSLHCYSLEEGKKSCFKCLVLGHGIVKWLVWCQWVFFPLQNLTLKFSKILWPYIINSPEITWFTWPLSLAWRVNFTFRGTLTSIGISTHDIFLFSWQVKFSQNIIFNCLYVQKWNTFKNLPLFCFNNTIFKISMKQI